MNNPRVNDIGLDLSPSRVSQKKKDKSEVDMFDINESLDISKLEKSVTQNTDLDKVFDSDSDEDDGKVE